MQISRLSLDWDWKIIINIRLFKFNVVCSLAFITRRYFLMEYHLIENSEKITITSCLIANPGVSVEANRRRFRDEFNKKSPRQTLVVGKINFLLLNIPRTGRPTTALHGMTIRTELYNLSKQSPQLLFAGCKMNWTYLRHLYSEFWRSKAVSLQTSLLSILIRRRRRL